MLRRLRVFLKTGLLWAFPLLLVGGGAACASVLDQDPAVRQPEPELLLEMPATHAAALKIAHSEIRALHAFISVLDHAENDSLRASVAHSLAEVNLQLDCVFGQDSRQQEGHIAEQEQIRRAEGCLNQLGMGSATIAGAQLAGYSHAIFAYPDVTFDEANKISQVALVGRNYVVMIPEIWECYTFAWGKVPYPSLPPKCR